MKKIFVMSLISLAVNTLLVSSVLGASINLPEYSTTFTSSSYMLVNGATFEEDQWTKFSVGGSSGQIIWFQHGSEIGRTNTPVSNANAPSGSTSLKLHSLDGGKVYAIEGYSTNPNSSHVVFEIPSNGGGSGGSSPDYTNALNQIKSAINSNGDVLGQIKTAIQSNGVTLNGLTSSVNSIKDQLTPSSSPNYPSFGAKPNLTDYKANEPSKAFKDNTNYFSDSGKAETVNTPFPNATEPDKWKDLDGKEINPDDELIKEELSKEDSLIKKDLLMDNPLIPDIPLSLDDLLDKSPIMKIEDPLKTDVIEKSPIMTKESLQQETPQNKSPILTKESLQQHNPFNQSPIMTKDALPNRKTINQTPILEKAPVMQQAPVDLQMPNWNSK